MFLLMSETVSENQVCLFKAGVFKLISAGPVSVPVLATPNQGLTNGAFPLHGTARYSTVRFTFGGFSTGYCTWYLILFSTTSVEVPCKPYCYQNVTYKLC